MRFFEKTLQHLPRDLGVQAPNFNTDNIESVLQIDKCDEKIISDYKIEKIIYQFHLKIDYTSLSKKREQNHDFFEKNFNKGSNILEVEYEINRNSFLFFADKENNLIPLSQSNTVGIYAYLAFYSFNKEWGYKLFVLRDYNFVLVEILKNNSNFTGMELKESLRSVFKERNEGEITTLCVELLRRFALTYNGINIVG